MNQTLSLNECAEHLGTSRGFIDTMITKGRLHTDREGRVAAAELEQLATLLSKLRGGGIAAMVDTVDQSL